MGCALRHDVNHIESLCPPISLRAQRQLCILLQRSILGRRIFRFLDNKVDWEQCATGKDGLLLGVFGFRYFTARTNNNKTAKQIRPLDIYLQRNAFAKKSYLYDLSVFWCFAWCLCRRSDSSHSWWAFSAQRKPWGTPRTVLFVLFV